jgi:hypothetical protein
MATIHEHWLELRHTSSEKELEQFVSLNPIIPIRCNKEERSIYNLATFNGMNGPIKCPTDLVVSNRKTRILLLCLVDNLCSRSFVAIIISNMSLFHHI